MDKQNARETEKTQLMKTAAILKTLKTQPHKLKLKNKIKTIKTLKIEKIKITATNC